MFGNLSIPKKKGVKTDGERKEIVFQNFDIGKKLVGVIVGEPVEVFKHYEGKYPNSHYLGICMGENCTFCQTGNTPRYSLRFNFLTIVDNTPTMTIAEGPASLARALADKEELKGVDFFNGTVIQINRTDKTAFSIDDIKPPPVLSNLKAILAEAEPYDLKGIMEAQIRKQTAGQDTTTNAPY